MGDLLISGSDIFMDYLSDKLGKEFRVKFFDGGESIFRHGD